MLLVPHLLLMKFSWGFDALLFTMSFNLNRVQLRTLISGFHSSSPFTLIKMHRPHIQHKLLSSLYWLNNLQFFEMKISTFLRNPFQHKHRNALIRDTHDVKLQIYYKPIHLNLIPTYLPELLYSDSIKKIKKNL